MYDNPNLNILLMGPGRTGSVTIVYYFSKVLGITPIVRNEDENVKPLMARQILHSHTPEDVRLANENTMFVLSTRDLVETAFSRLIARKTNRWRYIRNTGKVRPFLTTISDFRDAYDYGLVYYRRLKLLLPENVLRVDYDQFKDNDKNLLSILNIPEQNYVFANKNGLPTKTPGSYRDWIVNFDEINEFAKNLNRIPPI
jgi:hypothetical protein